MTLRAVMEMENMTRGIKIGRHWLTVAWQERRDLNWYQRIGLLIEGPGCGMDGRKIISLTLRCIGPA